MQFTKLLPKQSLNKAYLKEKLSRSAIDQFKSHFNTFLNNTNSNKSDEEHLKSQVAYFLRDTWYKESHHINPIGKNDLVIHTGKATTDSVGVIVEVKSLTNKAEMIGLEKPNAKAFHELVLYYLRQRIDEKNNEIKYLIATNIDEWFVFDANEFDKKIFRNTAIKRLFELKKTDGKDNPWFYDELKKLLGQLDDLDLDVTHFNLREFEQVIKNQDSKDDNKLIGIYKLLSPVHLLKLPFANDSNSLQPRFYAELLHLIGLTEVKEGSKKLIQRRKAGDRNSGSLLENTINTLDSHDKISRLSKPSAFGDTQEERLFNVALELVITWVNRILFLKLLEAQLASYHKGDKSYRFLNKERIQDFDDLDKLFFSVLAKKPEERREEINKLFGKVPYLNSSLFEPTELEHQTLFIYGLEDRVALPILGSTVLKSDDGKPLKGTLHTIDYLFAFLDAYDFSSEGSEEIQEDNKTLINASVLGLIFEKINGYKDGSFFTPGFITMYMCRETIRRAVVQKFNDAKGWDCKEYAELYNKISDTTEANKIINSLKICDPAVGSGHFLVSALNEIIAIKSDLNILVDRQGRRLKEYQLEVVNDELIITDEDGQLFDYNPKNKESQRVQEALFHEKQTIIESCLFGVDINPNSVKICRLRLWIELLKNAYYKESGQLETLPNIDINIKTGNSLISRFALDADLKQALKKSRFSIDAYKIAVQTYRNAKDKEEKREMESLIRSIKSDFRTEIGRNDPKLIKLNRLSGELYNITNQQQIFAESKAEIKVRKLKQEKLEKELNALSADVEEIKNNKIYENAFEWRFEFPEVLNDDGDFIGFDVVIGNPPYGVNFTNPEKQFFKQKFESIHSRTPESFNYFIYQFGLLGRLGCGCSLIIPSSFLNQLEFEKTRRFILESKGLYLNLNLGDAVFDDVATPTCIIAFKNGKGACEVLYGDFSKTLRSELGGSLKANRVSVPSSVFLESNSYSFVKKSNSDLIAKCFSGKSTLRDVVEDLATGISPGLADAFIITESNATESQLESEIVKKLIIGGEINRYYLNPKSKKAIIYFSSSLKINDFPNVKRHLDKFRDKLDERVETKSGVIPYYVMLRPRREKLFTRPKILIRQTANRILAAYDDEQWYCLKSGLILQLSESSELGYKYLLGLLNSKLLDFIYRDLVNEDVRIFPEVKPIQLFKLPIVIENEQIRYSIESLVGKIMLQKNENKNMDTSSLEGEIDRLVYQLYGLTEEEIRIVEGEVEVETAV
jgi:hypothetical protein